MLRCKFRSSGQTCVCANRIFVQSGIYDEFAKKFADKVKSFKVGLGFEGTKYTSSQPTTSQPTHIY